MVSSTLWTVATVLFGIALALGAYILREHKKLEARIYRHTVSKHLRDSERTKTDLHAIPHAVLSNPKALRHEKASIPVQKYTFQDPPAEIFTQLLRHTTPYLVDPIAYFFGGPETKEYVIRLNFIEGDMVSTYFRVVKRSPTRVEFSSHKSPGSDMAALLVIRLHVTETKGISLVLETLEWRSAGTGKDLTDLQLVRPCFMSNLGKAVILGSGAEFLITISRASQEMLEDDDFVIIPPAVHCAG